MYIKEENDKVIAYEVILDEPKLKKIKNELINNHSEVTIHQEFKVMIINTKNMNIQS